MTDEFPTPRAGRPEPLTVLWRILVAPQTLLVLLACVALAVTLATLLPQIPAQARADAQSWLAAQPGFLGQNSRLVQALSLHDILHSFLFRLLLALTGLVLVVRAADAADFAWRAAGRGRWSGASLAFWKGHSPVRRVLSPLSVEVAQARLADGLAARGLGRREVTDLPLPTVVAARRPAGLWARPVAQAALAVALLGSAAVDAGGWQNEEWQPSPGESRPVGHDTPYTIRLDAFDLEWAADGRLTDAASTVTWLEGSTPVQEDRLGTARRAVRRGIGLRQVGYVPVVRIRGRDAANRPLVLQTEGQDSAIGGSVELAFASPPSQPFLFLPGQGLFLVLSFDPCAQGRPALYGELLGEDGVTRKRAWTLNESGSVRLGEVRLEVDLAYRPLLRTDYRPGMALIVGAMAVAVVALAVAWAVPARLAWIVVGPGEQGTSEVQMLALPGADADRWLERLAEGLAEELTGER